MKWYIYFLFLTITFFYFIGWGLHTDISNLLISGILFTIALTYGFILYQKKKTAIPQGAFFLTFMPVFILYAIFKTFNSFESWKIIGLIISILFYLSILFLYYKTYRKRK